MGLNDRLDKMAKLANEQESDGIEVVTVSNAVPKKVGVKKGNLKIKPTRVKKNSVSIRVDDETYQKILDLQAEYKCSITALVETALDKL